MTQQQKFDDYDPRAWLERSGLIFLEHGAFSASIECFRRLSEMEPEYPMVWFGLYSAAHHGAGQTKNLALLRQSVGVLKHCLSLDPTNELAATSLESLPEQTRLTGSEIDAIQASTTLSLPPDLKFKPTTFAEVLPQIPEYGRRMQLVMWLGSFEHESSKELLIAALKDPNPSVVRASLKRLPREPDERVSEALAQMNAAGRSQLYEPYFSMAANRLGLPFTDSSL